MALESIVNTQAPQPDKSALQNAYKAFDLAKTLASIYGSANTMWATKAPSYGALQYQSPQAVGFNSSGGSLANFYNSLGK